MADEQEVGGWGANGELNWMSPEMKDAVDTKAAEDAAAQWEIAKDVAATFGKGSGKRTLERFRELTNAGRMFDPDDTDFHIAAAKGFFRSGQKAFIDWVDLWLKIAEQGPPNLKG